MVVLDGKCLCFFVAGGTQVQDHYLFSNNKSCLVIYINGRKSVRLFLCFLFHLFCKIYFNCHCFLLLHCSVVFILFFLRTRVKETNCFCCDVKCCYSPLFPSASLLARPVIEGQNSSATVAINSASSLPASIVLSLPTATPVRPNSTLSNRKAGTLPANLEEMKVPRDSNYTQKLYNIEHY